MPFAIHIIIYILVVAFQQCSIATTVQVQESSSPHSEHAAQLNYYYPQSVKEEKAKPNSSNSIISFPLHHANHNRLDDNQRRKYHRKTLRRRRQRRRRIKISHKTNDTTILTTRAATTATTAITTPKNQINELTEGPLYKGHGTYFIELWIGSPIPQPQTLIVDTGSEMTAFPCQDCHSCGKHYHVNDYFEYSNSTTFELFSCGECHLGSCDDEYDDKEYDYDEYVDVDNEDDKEEEDEDESTRLLQQKPTSLSSVQKKILNDDNQCNIKADYMEGSTWNAIEVEDLACIGSGSLGHDNYDRSSSLLHDKEKLDAVFQEEINESKMKYKRNKHEHCSPLSSSSTSQPFRLRFACQTSLTGLFRTQMADGILGMDRSKSAFWNQMYENGILPQRQFSLCLDSPSHKKHGSQVGVMTMGGTDKRLHTSTMHFAQLLEGSPWYTVYVKAIYLELPMDSQESQSSSLSKKKVVRLAINTDRLNRGEIILDSGTTDIYLPRFIRSEFKRGWKALVGTDYDPKQSYTSDITSTITSSVSTSQTFPTILLQMKSPQNASIHIKEADINSNSGIRLAGDLDLESPNDVIFTIRPESYMPDKYGGDSFLSMTEGEGQGSVLGSHALIGKNILFDVDNLQVGFADSHCNYQSLARSSGN